jgi:hypothetical protein
MKNRKWLTYTLGSLLTLVVLAAVAGVSFRIGMMQNKSFARPAFAHNFDGGRQLVQGYPQNNGGIQPMQDNDQNNEGSQPAQGKSPDNGKSQPMQGNFHENGGPQGMPGGFQGQGFGGHDNNRGGDRRDGRMPFFFPLFRLIHLAVLGLLVWLAYKLAKNSGWRITRVQAASAPPAPAASETASVEVKKNKTSK